MNDLVSRKAVIDELHSRFIDGFEEDRWWNSTHVLWAIKDVPSVQPDFDAYCDRLWKLAYERGKRDAQPQMMSDAETCDSCRYRYNEWDEEPCDGCTPADNRYCPDRIELSWVTQRWIPVTERLPENIRPVIVTWKNNDPESYYQYIVGKHFIGVAHFKGGKWYWYSSTTEDFLAEYGRYDGEEFDEAIEVVAWCELPEPWRGGQDE